MTEAQLMAAGWRLFWAGCWEPERPDDGFEPRPAVMLEMTHPELKSARAAIVLPRSGTLLGAREVLLDMVAGMKDPYGRPRVRVAA